MKVYRACSFLELETLLTVGYIEGFSDPTGAISCTTNYNFAKEITNNAQFTWKKELTKEDRKAQQTFIVVMDSSKLNNPIQIKYDLTWLRNHPDIYEHVFGTDDEYADEYSSGEDDTDILGTREELLETLVSQYEKEEEVIVFNHKMVDGMILKIEGSDFSLMSELSKVYKNQGYTTKIHYELLKNNE